VRSVATSCAAAGAALLGRIGPKWRWGLGALLGAVLLGSGVRTGGAALGLLAGGWSLGLVPVHSNRLQTGPRSRTGDSGQPAAERGSAG